MAGRNPLSQLVSLGEEALGKLAQNPATNRALQSALQLRDRVDDLSKRVRGLEGMDERFVAIERRLAQLEQQSGAADAGKPSVSKAKAGSAAKRSGSARRPEQGAAGSEPSS